VVEKEDGLEEAVLGSNGRGGKPFPRFASLCCGAVVSRVGMLAVGVGGTPPVRLGNAADW
jgi:hypothetical protein